MMRRTYSRANAFGVALVLAVAVSCFALSACITVVVAGADSKAQHDQTRAVGSSATADLLGDVAEEAADVMSASDEIEAAAAASAIGLPEPGD